MQRLNQSRTKENIGIAAIIICYFILFFFYEFFINVFGVLYNGATNTSTFVPTYEKMIEGEDKENENQTLYIKNDKGEFIEYNIEDESSGEDVGSLSVHTLRGIDTQLEMMLCILMVIKFRKKGMIVGTTLCLGSALFISFLFFVRKVSEVAPGIVAYLFTLLILHILYQYIHAGEVLSTIDSNTSVFNRNQYLEDLKYFTHRNLRSVGCAFVDVNGLHEHNNIFGHDSGDKLLRSVADKLKDTFPKAAIYRIGGDEFTLILTNCKKRELAEKLENMKKELYEKGIYIAVGMEWRRKNIKLDEMLKEADTEMYNDKNSFYKNHPEMNQRHTSSDVTESENEIKEQV